MRLADLLRGIPGSRIPDGAGQLVVRAVESDSRSIAAGDVFVAVRGEDVDGRTHAADAVARGAIAVVADAPVDVPVPVVRVEDARTALAVLAAEAVGRPADGLRLVGITGTVGKTSVLLMLEGILREAGIPAGTVGSLGIRYAGSRDTTPNTTPGALELQRALADMVHAGTDVVAMEVTSHALSQGRVHGLMYDLGVFTNLTMLEHLEYHGSFRAYAGAKRRFLQHLEEDAPLVYAAGDRAVAQFARLHPGPRVGCGGGAAAVTVRREPIRLDGTRITLGLRRPLPRGPAPPLPPITMPITLRAVGRPNITNATLAAVAGLCLGADPESVRAAMERFEPAPRRLQVIHRDGPVIIDDTVGHPDSITGVFEVAARVPHQHLRVVFAIRGQRGPTINERDAEALVIWSRRVPMDELAVTSAVDSADERNAVDPAERDAFLRVLDGAGVPYSHHDRLEDAVASAVGGAGRRDLVLLLGAQGMDAGAAIAGSVLAGGGARSAPPR
ncbi:MAG TPA: Mur ligase family protein [Longimicrobiales bacterium]|nr:Mur ligase family protein [Longimicrobiales bacterium]